MQAKKGKNGVRDTSSSLPNNSSMPLGTGDELFHDNYLEKRIIQAMNYIEKNYAEKMYLDEIAKEACLSKFHFIRIFKKMIGMTPHQYLTFVRIEKVKQMLKVDRAVSEVCFAVGFESIASFSMLFKRASGISPSLYL